MRLGSLVGTGRTADVFRYGAGAVVKVLRPGIPRQWAELEARLTAAVHHRGVRTPEVRGLVDIDGRQGIVFEHIKGPSMWQEMMASTADAERLARLLGAMHRDLRAEMAPVELPSLAERVADKVAHAEPLTDPERDQVAVEVGRLDQGGSLCHGDMHPGNVIMSPTGPVIIDWYDAAAGSPLADVVRTSLLIRPDAASVQPHLPGATTPLLGVIHAAYLREVLAGEPVPAAEIKAWESVLAAGRLAERADPDEARLVGLWRNRDQAEASVLLQDLDTLGVLLPGPTS